MAVTPKLFRATTSDAGKVCVINASGEAEFQALTGDVTISSAGVTTIGDGTVAPDDVALADTKIVVGDATGAGAAVSVSGDATLANTGALTVTDVTVGSDAAGDLLYKSSATALARLAKGAAGQVLQMNSGATAPEWSSAPVMAATFSFDSAAVIASNTTPLVLLDHSALVTAGTVASGDVLMYHGAVLQMDGGSAAYDQNQNFIAKYQTAGGGATVSTTVANFCNGAADGAMTTCKAITTDIVPEADQDIVLTSSASPKAAAGDRGLAGTVYYSVYTPV